jgi:tRNA (guanine-N(7)-)-methyltransferase subunit TRM82
VRVGESDKHAVLVSEKTGEAVAMPIPDIARDLKTLLTHTTSMITHMALTRDSKLLVTADRDEKIRVSRFPQTALVKSYCLGHKASVTRVACVHLQPAATDLLVSTSLDNTLKLWSVATGAQFDSHALLPDEEVASDDKALFTVSLTASPTANIVAVLVNYRTFHVFEVVVNEDGKSYALKQLEVLAEDKAAVLSGEPCEVTFAEDGKLVVAFKKAPYVQVFDVRLANSEPRITATIPLDNVCYTDLRKAASTIGTHFFVSRLLLLAP